MNVELALIVQQPCSSIKSSSATANFEYVDTRLPFKEKIMYDIIISKGGLRLATSSSNCQQVCNLLRGSLLNLKC